MAAYGHPAEVYELASVFWSVVFRQAVSPDQVAVCLALIKIAREINSDYPPDYHDNRDDLAGYANVMAMIHDYRRNQEVKRGPNKKSTGGASKVVDT